MLNGYLTAIHARINSKNESLTRSERKQPPPDCTEQRMILIQLSSSHNLTGIDQKIQGSALQEVESECGTEPPSTVKHQQSYCPYPIKTSLVKNGLDRWLSQDLNRPLLRTATDISMPHEIFLQSGNAITRWKCTTNNHMIYVSNLSRHGL